MVRVASDTLNSRVPDGPLQQKWDKHRFDLKLVNPANKRKFTVIVVGTGLAGGSAGEAPADFGPALMFAR